MRRAIAGCLLVLVAACTPAVPGSRAARLEDVRGAVTVDGTPARAGGLGNGARVRTAGDGSARVLIGGRSAELGPSSEIVVRRGALLLDHGSVLAAGGMRVEAEGSSVSTSGSVRVDRTLTLRAGAYEGSATLAVGTQRLAVERYREGSASAGFFPKLSRPLRVDAADRWDRRLLGDELELERSLESARVGLNVRPATVSLILAALSGPAVLPRLQSQSFGLLAPEEVVISAAIAALAPGPFGTRAGQAEELRTQGASWAVVAATLRANAEGVLARLAQAIQAGAAQPASPPGVSPATPRPGPSGSTPGPSAAPSPAPPTPSPAPTPTPTPGIVGTVTGVVCTLPLPILCPSPTPGP